MINDDPPASAGSEPLDAENTQRESSFSDDLAAAVAKKSGIDQLARSEGATGAALLGALGGVRGLVEAILPGLVFLVLFTITEDVPLSLGASVAVAIVFVFARAVTRSPMTQAVAGLIGVGASAILALITGRAQDNFVLGLWLNAAYALGLLVSMVIRWPVIGLAAGYLMGEGTSWREKKSTFRIMQALTFLWLLLFAVRLAVGLPLYFAAATGALAVTTLLMGVPLYSLVLIVTWLVIRSLYPASSKAP
jgi:hypothetical protein